VVRQDAAYEGRHDLKTVSERNECLATLL